MKRNQVGLTALDLLLFSLERYCSSTPGNCSNERASGNEGVEECCGAKRKAGETQVRKIGRIVIEYQYHRLCHQTPSYRKHRSEPASKVSLYVFCVSISVLLDDENILEVDYFFKRFIPPVEVMLKLGF